MKKFILFLITLFCINSFIPANANYYNYHKQRKANAAWVKKYNRQRAKAHKRPNYGKFKSTYWNTTYNGVYVHKKCKFAKRNPAR